MTSLNAQLKASKSEFDKLKFARDAYTIGRHPSIKDGLGFKREAKNLTSHKAPISAKEKGKAPMASSVQKNHAFMYHDRRQSRNAYDAFDSHAMFASSSSYMHGDCIFRLFLDIAYIRNRSHLAKARQAALELGIYRACILVALFLCQVEVQEQGSEYTLTFTK